MHPIVRSFQSRAVERGGLLFFKPSDALTVVNQLRQSGVRVLGLDAVRVGANYTQPSMADSIDLSDETTANWDKAEAFLTDKLNSKFLFEIVAGG
jgi:DNA-binding XRE family transcriptional regulator